VSHQDGINWAGVDIRRVQHDQGSSVFRQGDDSTTVLYVEQGTVRLSVVSPAGNEAVVEVLAAHAFFGEGCLVGQPRRVATATAVTPCTIVEVEKREMARQLRTNAALARRFLFHVLKRNVRIQGDLLDCLTPSTS
jgi:CRP/FNR family cyclic AMP-dependent transcriptional regulator